MANLYPRGVSYGDVFQAFADSITSVSGGRLEIDMVYDGEGVGATEVLSATSSGLVEMGAPYMALHAGELPAGVVELTLPGAPTQVDHLMALFYEGGWIDTLRGAYAEHNLHYLAPSFQPGVMLITKEPVNTLADLEGKVLRSPGAYGKFMRLLGCEPVVMAFSEMYPSMATGVIDGAASSNVVDYADINLVEIAKYMYPRPVTGAQVAGLIVNMDAWNTLSDDLKAIMEIAAVWHGMLSANKSTMWVRSSINKMEAAGLIWNPEPSEGDKAKWAAAGAGLADEYAAADKWSAKLIEQQRAFMKTMGI
jgi:TRAP-type C4-dicarboxylate transport system substrate-binding protein